MWNKVRNANEYRRNCSANWVCESQSYPEASAGHVLASSSCASGEAIYTTKCSWKHPQTAPRFEVKRALLSYQARVWGGPAVSPRGQSKAAAQEGAHGRTWAKAGLTGKVQPWIVAAKSPDKNYMYTTSIAARYLLISGITLTIDQLQAFASLLSYLFFLSNSVLVWWYMYVSSRLTLDATSGISREYQLY